MNTDNLTPAIKEILVAHGRVPEDIATEELEAMELIHSGVIKSLMFVELLDMLEEDFGLIVDVEKMDENDFTTIASIANLVQKSAARR